MMRSGEEGLRATSRRTRRRNAVTLMKKERTLTMRARGTGSQVLPGSGVKDGGIIKLDHEPVVCVNLDTLDFVEED